MRQDKFEQVLIVLGTLFFSVFGMMAPSAWAQNPTPSIDALLPVSAHLDDLGFVLTVRGTGFASSAVVYWQLGTSTTPLETTFVTGTELRARVPALLLKTEATAQITVRNTDVAPDDGISNAQFFSVTIPSPIPIFSPIVLIGAVGGFGFSSVTGDFNGDGRLDLAICSFGTVSILLGNGNGTFTPSASLKVSTDAYSIATGDFNGDGKLDIVVPGDSTVSIFLGNGDGSFTAAPTVTIGEFLYNVVVGDVNGDGKLDLVVTDLPNEVHTLLGNGDGTFTASQTTIVGTASDETQLLKMGDFNGDGKLDIAVLTLTGEGGADFAGTATILLGDGTGGFSPKDIFGVGYVYLAQGDFTSMGVGDFNNDGKLDLAVSGCGASAACNSLTTTIYLGNGDGTFTTKSTSPVGGGFMSVGDINGDGHLDLALSSPGGVSLLLGKGDGTFDTLIPAGGNGFTVSVVMGDFNQDGRLDLAAATATYSSAMGNVITLLQQPPSLTPSPAVVDFLNFPVGVAKVREVTLINSSSAPVLMAGVTITTPGSAVSDFAAYSLCPPSLGPGARCKVIVVYFNKPGVVAPTATLNVSYDAFGTPLLVPLRGIW